MSAGWLRVESPIGDLILVGNDDVIWAVRYADDSPASRERALPGQEIPCGSTAAIRQTRTELEEYFEGRRREFGVNVVMRGTRFQKTVWRQLVRVPCGEVATYGQVASLVGAPRAARAVGSANRRNPVAIIVPCHRVVGAGGKLRGYSGGLERQRFLLGLEARNSPDG